MSQDPTMRWFLRIGILTAFYAMFCIGDTWGSGSYRESGPTVEMWSATALWVVAVVAMLVMAIATEIREDSW